MSMDERGSVKQRQGADGRSGWVIAGFHAAWQKENQTYHPKWRRSAVQTEWNGTSRPPCLQNMPVVVRCLCKQAFSGSQRSRRGGAQGWLAGRGGLTRGAGGLKVKNSLQPNSGLVGARPAAPGCFLIHTSQVAVQVKRSRRLLIRLLVHAKVDGLRFSEGCTKHTKRDA